MDTNLYYHVSIVIGILTMLFRAVVFRTNHIPMWKSFIPIYGEYVFARDVAKTPEYARKNLILTIAVLVVTCCFYAVVGVAFFGLIKSATYYSTQANAYAIQIFIAGLLYTIFVVVALVFSLIFNKKIFQSYNEINGYDNILSYIGMFFPIVVFAIYVIQDLMNERNKSSNQE